MNLVDFNIDHLNRCLEFNENVTTHSALALDLQDSFLPNQAFTVVKCHESIICLNPGQFQDVCVSVAKSRFSAVTLVMLDDIEHLAFAQKI